jgi:hypothetical protein
MRFERGHFAQPANVSFFVRELSREKRIHQISSGGGSHDSGTNTEDVHIVVLYTLMSRVMVVHQSSANPGNLIRTDRGAHSAAANRNSAFHFAAGNRLSERNDKVRIIVARIEVVGPHVNHFVPSFAKADDQRFLQAETTMIRCDSYAHLVLLLRYRQPFEQPVRPLSVLHLSWPLITRPLSSKIVMGSTLKIYPGAPHGMCSTLKDRVNEELLSFIVQDKLAAA